MTTEKEKFEEIKDSLDKHEYCIVTIRKACNQIVEFHIDIPKQWKIEKKIDNNI